MPTPAFCYPVGMNRLPEPISGQFTLAVLPQGASLPLLHMVARLALRGPLRVLDSGNRFNAYTVAQSLRRHTGQVEAALARIRIARAFTCYQVAALLAETPALPASTLVLDLLATFRDESVPLWERRRLLEACLDHLRRLASQAPLLASVTAQGAAGADELLALLEGAAGQVWRFAPPLPPAPLRLF
ncbi:MAG TPA: hypothetical protein VLA49_18735 [Anaerolineales bacterium]|nr:hypothetical protein [Anaerolineales bacterium]